MHGCVCHPRTCDLPTEAEMDEASQRFADEMAAAHRAQRLAEIRRSLGLPDFGAKRFA